MDNKGTYETAFIETIAFYVRCTLGVRLIPGHKRRRKVYLLLGCNTIEFYLLIWTHFGAVPNQLPSIEQNLDWEPSSLYPRLQVYLASAPYVDSLCNTSPFSGFVSVPQSVSKWITSKAFNYKCSVTGVNRSLRINMLCYEAINHCNVFADPEFI